MSNDQDQRDLSSPNGDEPKPESTDNDEAPSSMGLTEIVKLITSLNICRKNVFSYPPEHDQVQQSIDSAFGLLNEVLEIHTQIILGVTGDSMIVELAPPADQPEAEPVILPLEPSHIPCHQFAQVFKQVHVATVTISPDIDKEELYRFLEVTSKTTDSIEEQGGMEIVTGEADLPSIDIQMVDYGRFKTKEEEAIAQEKDDEKETASKSLWEKFAVRLMAGDLMEGGSAGGQEEISPEQLSQQINESEDIDAILKDYEKSISEYFTTEGDVGMDPATWVALLPGLKTSIRKKFFAILFEQLNKHSELPRAEQMLSVMDGKIVKEMIDQARENNQAPSRPFIKLMKKMVANPKQWPKTSKKISGIMEAWITESQVLPDKMRQALLEDIKESPALDIEDIIPTLEDSHLNIKIARLLTGFMNGNIKPAEYSDFAERLAQICDELLEIGNFSATFTVFKTIVKHVSSKEDPEIKVIAGNTVQTLTGSSFAAKAVSAYTELEENNRTEEDDLEEAVNLLIQIGPAVLPELVKRYADHDTFKMTTGQRQIFQHFGLKAADEAQELLDGTQPAFTRNLILLIQMLDAKDSVKKIKRFMKHENEELRNETIKTMLQFDAPEACDFVREMINSRRSRRVSQGIALAGEYNGSELIPDLAEKLKRFVFFKSDIDLNIEIIKTMAKTGNPEALPHLFRLAKTFWPLYSKKMTEMKLELFRSLSSYPKKATQDLLVMGQNMRNQKISSACKQLGQKTPP